MYKKDLALNELQWLICHKTKQTNKKNALSKDIEAIKYAIDIINLIPTVQKQSRGLVIGVI